MHETARRPRARHALFAALATLAGCAVGPDYRAPEVAVAERFDAVGRTRAFRESEVDAEFWRQFRDPLLDELVEEAFRANHDLRIAVARLVEARALRREALYDFFPTVTASAGRTEALQSRWTTPGVPRAQRETDLYDVTFDAFWELDLFGRVRRGEESRRAEAAAARAGLQFAQVTMVAELVRGYFELRGLQEQLAVAERNAGNQQATLDLTVVRLEGGRGTELDRARAGAQLLTTRAAIPVIEAQVLQSMYRLAVLSGRRPEELEARLAAPVPLPTLSALHAIGTPADLLRRRPDVVAAERRLAGATARIGVAIADVFPRVSLVGTASGIAPVVGDVGNAGNDSYSFGPRLDWAFLDLGRVRERIVQSRAGAAGALASYEQTVLRALEETEGALVRYDRLVARTSLLEHAAVESATAARLARRRFDGGVADFLTVLDAERTQLEADDRLVRARTETATALVAVYKALGGGWRAVD